VTDLAPGPVGVPSPEDRDLAEDANASPVIQLDGVGKRYWQLEERTTLLRSLVPFRRPHRREMWAVQGVNVRISRGETVGILGRNGAGKTTLLRMLAGVTRPTRGQVTVRGRIAPLISVGVGFHQEMSGRENIFVNGMLLGLSHAEVADRFDDIVEFAELGDFIETPVKFYSSGMFMRLGFAVAVHVDPAVLLVDEVLAVGDGAFQLKCFERMRALQTAGATIVLVSHSMHAIRLMCPRALLFRRGQLVFDGEPEQAIAQHYQLLSDDNAALADGSEDLIPDVQVLHRELRGPAETSNSVDQHERLRYRMRVRFVQDVVSPQVVFLVKSDDGTVANQMMTRFGRPYRTFRAGEETDIEIEFISHLVGGTFRIEVSILSEDGGRTLFHDHAGAIFYVAPTVGSLGIAELDTSIRVAGHLLSEYESFQIGGRVAPAETDDSAG
jgi:ABC-2 type transport system ATP-binding protein